MATPRQVRRRGRRLTLVLGTVLAAVAFAAVALADDISNNLDASVDAVAEVMPLTQGGANGTTQLYVVPQNGDGKNGCNLTGSTGLVVSVSSDNTLVATVSPSSITFGSCGDTPTLTVTPVAAGSATISVSQTSNSTAGTFNLAPATFTVNVSPPPNTPPAAGVTGVTAGASYDKGSVPAANCEVTDAEDGNSSFPATLSAITGPYAADGIGEQTASCSYTDAGGLTATASVTYGIVDPSAPVISSTIVGTLGNNGWYVSGVTLIWTVSEPESPNSFQKTGCDDQSITADQAATMYSCSATSAGGSSGPVDVSIKRDATAPTITGSASPAPNGNGWNNTDVTAAFSCGDNLSGVASCGPNQTLSVEGAGQSADGTAVDGAGNSTGTTVSGINIDKTAPTVTVTGVTDGATYTLGSVPAAGCSTTDGLSGVQTSATLGITGGPVGSITATCSGAEDSAGNPGSTSATYTVVYAFDGFFRPVDNPPVCNKVKAGSAVPVKFSLGGYQGLGIFMAGSPSSSPGTCAGEATDPIEETSTAGNSSLSYDATVDQYVYVWKTEKSWAGTARLLTVRLADGTTHTARFTFTK